MQLFRSSLLAKRDLSIVVLCLLLALCSACAKRTQAPLPTVEEDSRAVTSEIATFIGTSPEGARRTFADGDIGPVTVVVGRSYHSALNIPCREAYFQGAQHSRTAACHDKTRGWVLAPAILGDGSL